MDKEKIFKSILDGNAILITGSGAHVGVLTPDGNKFATGIGLAREIYRLCGIANPENPWDLQDATDTYIEKFKEESLIQELKKRLMVGSIRNEHRELYSCNWQRVYTTNYDMTPRISTSKAINALRPITLSMKRNEKDLEQNLCIYINGCIENLDKNTLKNEFKLTGRSYLAAQALEESEWGAVFSEDIVTADCIIIVGLSLDYDLEIKRFLYGRNVFDKTIFIESQDISQDKKRKMERMGSVLPIGMEQFVNELEGYKKSYNVVDKNDEMIIYKSFDIYGKKFSSHRASTLNVYDLFMTGKIIDELWYRDKGKYVNIIYRCKLGEVIDYIKNDFKVIYIHANLGNGKTFFVESLKHQLQRSNYKIFTLIDSYQGITNKEIKSIVEEHGKKLVVIENYYNYINVIKNFAVYNLEEVQFVFTSRTVLYDTRLSEVEEILNISAGKSAIFDINKLSDFEVNSLNQILNSNGLWGKNSKITDTEKRKILKDKNSGNRELQSILVGVLKSPDMKKKIEIIVNDIKKMSDNYYDVLVLALLIKTMSLNISANDMNRILHMDLALDAKFVNNAGVREILDFSSGKTEFKLKSAITANMILKELDCNEEIIKVLTLTAKYANRYRNIERYENILKNIISYSHVRTFLANTSQKEKFLINYYNSLKELEYYRENSFYWLQYSIVCINIEKYKLAQTYLDNAYAWFRDTEEVVPFQIDTQQARLYLLLIEKGRSVDVKSDFEKAHLLLMKPVVSLKDNPAKQISIFKSYLQREVKEKLYTIGCAEFYRKCCGEAYNKVTSYLKNVRIENDKERFNGLSKKLLQNSVK